MCALGRAGPTEQTVSYEEQACAASLVHPQVTLTGEAATQQRVSLAAV